MSENKNEVPKRDRAKVSNLYPSIAEIGREKCQDNFDVGYGNGVNVKKPSLRGKGEER